MKNEFNIETKEEIKREIDHQFIRLATELKEEIDDNFNKANERLITQQVLINTLEDRIDKAIEYIPKIIISGKSEHSFNEFAVDFQQTKEGKILLDILKGKDKQ